MLSSRSIKLRWTISYPPEHELIDGFFVGYRSFDTSALLAEPGAGSVAQTAQAAAKQALERPTFTYKTIRLTNQQQQSAPEGGLSDHQQLEHHQTPLLSPVSSVTKTVPAGPSVQVNEPAGSKQQVAVVVVSNFEYTIAGLERNTEYTILIQCFNKKGAGPTSDPVVFKTFASGECGPEIRLHRAPF